jgi:hypothetical protein
MTMLALTIRKERLAEQAARPAPPLIGENP